MNPYLSREDLSALTGLTTQAAQRRWLIRGNWPHEVGNDGHPRVLRAYHDNRLMGLTPSRKSVAAQPNWLRAA